MNIALLVFFILFAVVFLLRLPIGLGRGSRGGRLPRGERGGGRRLRRRGGRHRGDRFCRGIFSVLGVGLTRTRLENVAHFELVAVAAVVFGVQHLLEEQAHLFANQCRAVPFDAVLTLYLLRLRLFDLGDPHQR